MKRFAIQITLAIIAVISLVISYFVLGIVYPGYSPSNAVSEAIAGSTTKLAVSLGIWLAILAVLIFVAYLFLKKKDMVEEVLVSKKDNVATSKFSKEKDFSGITGNDGLPIGKKFRLTEKKSFEHYAMFGPTGSGKSVSFFIPALLDLPAHASVVVTDPKGELFQLTAQRALNQGKKVLVFSPFREATMKYNPLSLCRDVTEVRELAQVLLANGNAAIEQLTGTKSGGSEWTNMATPLLVAFLIFVKKLEAPNNAVHRALEIIIENDLDTLKLLIEDSEPEAQQQMNIFLQSAESEKTASSIKTVLATSLQMFTDPMIKNVTSLNQIDPKDLRKHPTHLYVIIPESKSSFMSPLMSPFYNQLMTHLVEDGKGAPVYFLLDEFSNIGIIPNFDTALSTIRSRKMSVSVGLQSINQLKQRYGDAAGTILDNLKTKAFLPGLSFDSAEYASKMIGYKEIESMSTSFGVKQQTSHSVSKQKRELMTPDEIRRLEDETILIITDNRNPFIDKQNRYYQNKRLESYTSEQITVEEYLEETQEK